MTSLPQVLLKSLFLLLLAAVLFLKLFDFCKESASLGGIHGSGILRHGQETTLNLASSWLVNQALTAAELQLSFIRLEKL